jgi:hypothetical protein
MQRVDDVTGEALLDSRRLSATQREEQREAMVRRLQELTQANNLLYARVQDCEARTADALTACQFVEARLSALERRTVWQWLRGC